MCIDYDENLKEWSLLTLAHDETLGALVASLLVALSADRVTIRFRGSDAMWMIVAESRRPPARSLVGSALDIRNAATLQHIQSGGQLLVQADTLTATPSPPKALIENFGVRAQIVAPVMSGDRLVALVSVHSSTGPRIWAPTDVRLVSQAAADCAEYDTRI